MIRTAFLFLVKFFQKDTPVMLTREVLSENNFKINEIVEDVSRILDHFPQQKAYVLYLTKNISVGIMKSPYVEFYGFSGLPYAICILEKNQFFIEDPTLRHIGWKIEKGGHIGVLHMSLHYSFDGCVFVYLFYRGYNLSKNEQVFQECSSQMVLAIKRIKSVMEKSRDSEAASITLRSAMFSDIFKNHINHIEQAIKPRKKLMSLSFLRHILQLQ